MPRRDEAYIDDISRAAELILVFLDGYDQNAFRRDLKTQAAVIR